MQRGQMGRPMTNIAPKTVESAIIAEGEAYIKRAKEEFRLKPDEVLLAFCIAPISQNVEASIAVCHNLRGKLKDKKKRLQKCMVVPEPRHNGHAHYNVIARLCVKDVMNVLARLKALFQRHGLIFKPWTDPDTGEFTYTYEQQCIDDNSNRTPAPIGYALKTMLSWVGLKSHDIATELKRRKTRDAFASAIEAKIWRRNLRLNVTFGHKNKKIPSQKTGTFTSRKHQITSPAESRAKGVNIYKQVARATPKPLKSIPPLERSLTPEANRYNRPFGRFARARQEWLKAKETKVNRPKAPFSALRNGKRQIGS